MAPTTLGWCIVCTLLWLGADGARRVDLDLHLSRRSLQGKLKNPESLATLGAGEDLKVVTKLRTVPGKAKVKMQETYQGLPVVGETVVVEVDDNGHMTGDVSGRLVEHIADDLPSTEPRLSPDDALGIALKSTRDPSNDVIFDPRKDARLQVQVQNTQSEKVQVSLVYQLSYRIELPHRISRPTFIIDANTGNIVKQWEGLSLSSWKKKKRDHVTETPLYKLVEGVGGNKKVGKHLYGLDLPELRVTAFPNGTCSLENQYALVYNCNHTFWCSGGQSPHQFDCNKGNNDFVNDAYSPLNDAFFYIGITYEMYAEWYGASDPLHTADINGGRCAARIHFGKAFENAFWDGELITFGDGADVMYPLTSVNVVAHEISHGVTEKNSGLIYFGESGGMNEAFSDMAGEAAEEFLRHKIDWMVGFEIWKKENESMRYFDDPEKDGRSIGQFSDYCFSMNVHFSSGVYNRAFYILSRMPGWCVRQAFHVFFIANDLYWTPESTFHGGACDVKRAAKDLGLNEQDVVDAFRKVGVEPCSEPNPGQMKPLMKLENDTTVTFKLKSRYEDPPLDYNEYILFIAAMGGGADVTLRSETTVYKVTTNGHSSRPIVLSVQDMCKYATCQLDVKSASGGEMTFIIVPLAPILTLIGGGNLRSENDTLEAEFEIPENILENDLKVAFLGTATTGGFSYFIRHELPPNVDSFEFDMHGDSHGPAIMCKSRRGKYYIQAKIRYGEAENVDIRLAAILTGEEVSRSLTNEDTVKSTAEPGSADFSVFT